MFAIDLNPIDDIVQGLVGLGGAAIGDGFKASMAWTVAFLVNALVHAASTVLTEVFGFFNGSSSVVLTSGWWTGPANQALLATIGKLTALMMVVFVLLAVLDGLLHGNPGEMLRSAFLQLPLSAFGTATVVAFTTVLLSVSDEMSGLFLSGGASDANAFVGLFHDPAGVASAGLLGALFTGLLVLGGVAVWVELLIRSAFIYFLIPIAYFLLAARIWRPARQAWHRLVSIGLALIFAKPCIALALALGKNAIDGVAANTNGTVGTQAGAHLSALLIAAVLLLLAMFSPFVLLKLLPIAEAAVVAHGVSRAPARAAQSTAQAAYGIRMLTGPTTGGSPRSTAGPTATATPDQQSGSSTARWGLTSNSPTPHGPTSSGPPTRSATSAAALRPVSPVRSQSKEPAAVNGEVQP